MRGNKRRSFVATVIPFIIRAHPKDHETGLNSICQLLLDLVSTLSFSGVFFGGRGAIQSERDIQPQLLAVHEDAEGNVWH